MPTLRIKRGLRANLPTTGMLTGEQFHTTDRGSLHVATSATAAPPVVVPIDELATLASVNGAADFVMLHDADATGVKEKKMTFDAFKSALNIPPGSSDERVAVVAGGTSGYLWGTTGSDGVLRVANSLAMTKDAGNGFVTLSVGDIDCGTF
jgi:hypothetical protein